VRRTDERDRSSPAAAAVVDGLAKFERPPANHAPVQWDAGGAMAPSDAPGVSRHDPLGRAAIPFALACVAAPVSAD